jgi:hypothetical protein
MPALLSSAGPSVRPSETGYSARRIRRIGVAKAARSPFCQPAGLESRRRAKGPSPSSLSAAPEATSPPRPQSEAKRYLGRLAAVDLRRRINAPLVSAGRPRTLQLWPFQPALSKQPRPARGHRTSRARARRTRRREQDHVAIAASDRSTFRALSKAATVSRSPRQASFARPAGTACVDVRKCDRPAGDHGGDLRTSRSPVNFLWA